MNKNQEAFSPSQQPEVLVATVVFQTPWQYSFPQSVPQVVNRGTLNIFLNLETLRRQTTYIQDFSRKEAHTSQLPGDW